MPYRMAKGEGAYKANICCYREETFFWGFVSFFIEWVHSRGPSNFIGRILRYLEILIVPPPDAYLTALLIEH